MCSYLICYVRTKEGKEIDFVVCLNGKPTHLIEVKSSDEEISKSFSHFLPQFHDVKATQLVRNCRREKMFPNGLEIRALVP